MRLQPLAVGMSMAAVLATGCGTATAPSSTSPSSTPVSPSARASAASPGPTSTPTPDAYSGWKTYTSTYEGASFRYPPTWSVSIAPEPVSNGNVYNGNVVTLTSPLGSVVHFEAPSQDQGGGCSSDVTIEQVTKLSAQAKNPLYLAVVDHSGQVDFGVYDVVPPASNNYASAAAIPTVGERICRFYPSYTGRTQQPRPLNQISFYSTNTQKVSLPAFLASQDGRTEQLIFSSLQY